MFIFLCLHPHHTGAGDTPTRSRHGQALDTKLRMQWLQQQHDNSSNNNNSVISVHMWSTCHAVGQEGRTVRQTGRLRQVTGHIPMAFLTVFLHERPDYAPWWVFHAMHLLAPLLLLLCGGFVLQINFAFISFRLCSHLHTKWKSVNLSWATPIVSLSLDVPA